ncbi:hypothetical protein A2935_03275 [Candidatus Wolfebacteria bacterium RIFCSPLOWO2_01_FULL_47_17b]|uniref:Phenylalanine ammonia-lyase n=1 Tax=Candidatus Wolfebacteria bacterium RIFCSPLOWO2_01_FULL_47_17b TaxID=1802558 RepID=A0A1F8DYP3_9BACT|nr:MAG: hypothetical protein A2935_03275 [Candidatus Wolfebacteria bacterium RIFCSPLOWO2_01_FULL_47_17b]
MNTRKKNLRITVGYSKKLTLEQCMSITIGNPRISVSRESYKKTNLSEGIIRLAVDKNIPVYGVTTQFGGDANKFDPLVFNAHLPKNFSYDNSLRGRQVNLVRSHMSGVGEEIDYRIGRIAILLRLHSLAQGYSGVRPVLLDHLRGLLDKKIIPVMRRYGSVGASGDLIPLAAIAGTLIGEKSQMVYFGSDRKKMSAPHALQEAKIKPIYLNPKEGLALMNGTSLMTAVAATGVYDLKNLFYWMLVSIAISLESLRVIGDSYEPFVHEVKGHAGEILISDFLKKFWGRSNLLLTATDIPLDGSRPIQDFYSVRSVSQGFGPFYENMSTSMVWIEQEINSVNDNPIINPKTGKIYGTANFMGYYITSACDILKMDIAQASTWIHAIFANLIHPRKNNGLPSNLMERPDLYSGFKPLQILMASLAVENRKLAVSHQAFMLPTEGDNQDVNSLGTHAAIDLLKAVDNLRYLVVLLLLAGVQAIELRGVSNAGGNTQIIFKKIRSISKYIDRDRSMSGDIETLASFIHDHSLNEFIKTRSLW